MEKGDNLSNPGISSGVEKVISDDTDIVKIFTEICVNIDRSLKIWPKV